MRKELSEILRDRRTIITLVLMPLLLYPLLSMAFQQFLLANVPTETFESYKIGVASNDHQHVLGVLLSGHRDTLAVVGMVLGGQAMPPLSRPVFVAGLLQAGTTGHDAPLARLFHYDAVHKKLSPQTGLTFFEAPDIEQLVRSGAVHLGIRTRQKFQDPALFGPDVAVDWELLYNDKSPASREALRLVENLCLAANARLMQDRLDAWGQSQRATPIRMFRGNVIGAPGDEPLSLAAVIPLILILMTITGAVYPAIDLTAGERERGTLEILVAAPVSRMALLFAKYVSVVTVAVLTALVNLVMMAITLQFSGLSKLVFGDAGLSFHLMVQIFALLLLFAAFFSAVLLTLTSFARSFKEAQAYLIPLMLVSLAPGLAGLLPGLRLSGIYTVLPLINIVLLARDLMEGVAEPALAAVVVGSTVLYAVAAIATAARFFGAEAVLYSEQSGWSDLFRRPSETQPAATIAAALFCLALIFPLFFVLTSALAYVPLAWHSLFQLLGIVLMFAVLPLASALLGRVQLVSGFQLRGVAWYLFPTVALLGLALIPLVHELLTQVQARGLTLLGLEQLEQYRRLMGASAQARPVFAAACLALIGVIEEGFFRGYLLSALRATSGALTSIAVSALLFGLFHAVPMFDRLLPSFLLGLVLGWVAWRIQSVLPSMVLHASYNFAWSLIGAMPATFGLTSDHFPWTWLAAATGAAVLAVAVIGLSTRSAASR